MVEALSDHENSGRNFAGNVQSDYSWYQPTMVVRLIEAVVGSISSGLKGYSMAAEWIFLSGEVWSTGDYRARGLGAGCVG